MNLITRLPPGLESHPLMNEPDAAQRSISGKAGPPDVGSKEGHMQGKPEQCGRPARASMPGRDPGTEADNAARTCSVALSVAAMLLAAMTAAAAAADGTARLEWRGSTEIATGGGERGPWQQNESRYDYVDDPSVALDASGTVAVAWVDQSRKDVFFRRIGPDGSQTDGPLVNVSRSPATFSWLPRVALAADAPDQVFVLWQEIIFSGGSHGGEMFFARSVNGGKTFSAPLNLSHSVGGDGKGRITKDVWHNGSFDLVAAPGGVLYAAWTEYDGPLWFSRSTDGGASFSAPQQIAGGDKTKPARAPSLAVGPDRNIYLAWTTGEDKSADIRIARSTDGGTRFSVPQVIAPSKGYSDAPKLAFDRAGVLHLVYAESAGGPFDRYHIRYTRAAAGTGNFDAPRNISTPLPPPFASAAFPALGIDANDRIHVLWELYPDHRQRPRGLGITMSGDGGRSFTAPLPVPGSMDADATNGSHQGLLMQKLAVNAAGAVVVANSSLRQGERSRVWLLRAQAK
jgi:hypothetical protein